MRSLLIVIILTLYIAGAKGQSDTTSIAVKDTTSLTPVDSLMETQVVPKEEPVKLTNNEVEKIEIPAVSFEIDTIFVENKTFAMQKGDQWGFRVVIPDADPKDVTKRWSKFIRNKTKNKVVEDGSNLSIQQTLIERLHHEPVNIYSEVIEVKDGTRLTAFMEIQGEFLSRENRPEQEKIGEMIIRNFAIEQYKDAIKDQIKDEKRALNRREHELTHLQRENEKLHKNILRNESQLENTLRDIKNNEKNQELQAQLIRDQKEFIQDANNKDERKDAKKYLRTLEKEMKQMQREYRSLNEDLAGYRAEIEESKQGVTINLHNQKLKKVEYAEQLAKVKSLNAKLREIR